MPFQSTSPTLVRGVPARSVTTALIGESAIPAQVLGGTNTRVVVSRLPALNAQDQRSTPSRPHASGNSMPIEVAVGDRRVTLEGSRNVATEFPGLARLGETGRYW